MSKNFEKLMMEDPISPVAHLCRAAWQLRERGKKAGADFGFTVAQANKFEGYLQLAIIAERKLKPTYASVADIRVRWLQNLIAEVHGVTCHGASKDDDFAVGWLLDLVQPTVDGKSRASGEEVADGGQ